MNSAPLRPRPVWLLASFVLAFAACRAGTPTREAITAEGRLVYPEAPRSDLIDVYHGQAVADPYRPLEDPDAAPTRAWIEAENRLTQAWLAQLDGREALRSGTI
jgi:prolyl oligopeptidase